MIVDCHTQVWDPGLWQGQPPMPVATASDPLRSLEIVNPVDRAIVHGFKSCYLSTQVTNRTVAEFVGRSPKLVGFAGIDPTDAGWRDELRAAHEEYHLKGVTLSPALQSFHPADTRAMRLYEECVRRGLPVFFEQHHRNPASKMEYARPALLDEVAREFPELRLVIGGLGYPWVDEAVVVLAKHTHAYADVGGLLRFPWLSYNALVSAFEFGVIQKMLFGSGFPSKSPAAAIEALYSVNQVCHGSALRPIPREHLRGIVERETLVLLGIERAGSPAPRAAADRPLVSSRMLDDVV
ncbi:MAG: amidohydrolase [Planctomycetia bacterium]|nr:MAG: amidohydrolase [Planctomycetia bacterium]